MATEVERLVATLEANVKGFERQMAKANATANRELDGIEKRAARTKKEVERQLGSISASAITSGLARGGAAILAALGVDQIRRAADEYTALGNRFRTLGQDSDQVVASQKEVVQISLAARAQLGATGDLYAKLLPLASQYGLTAKDAATATLAVSQALSAAGVDAGAASGAIRQLGQALGSGVLRGDEFNSIMEALGTQSPLIQAIASEFGVTAQQLRELAQAGDLVADRVFKAIIEAGPSIKASFDQSIPTTSQALENLQTAATALLGELDRGIGVTNAFAAAMGYLADAAGSAASALASARKEREANDLSNDAYLLGITKDLAVRGGRPEEAAQLDRQLKDIQSRQAQIALAKTIGGSQSVGMSYNAPYFAPAAIDMPVARPGSALGDVNGTLNYDNAGTGSRKAAISGAEQQKKAVDDLLKSLAFETDQIGRTALQQEIYNNVQRAGVDISSAAGQQIAAATTKLYEQEAAYKAAAEQAQYFGNIAYDALASLIIDGDSASDVVSRLAKSLAEAALQAALLGKGPLADLFGTTGGGLLGSIFGGLFGRAGGGPVSAGQPYIVGEKRPEVFIPSTPGRILPSVPTAPAANMNAPQPLTVNIDARGSTADAVVALEKRIPSIVQQTFNQSRRRGMV
jgi:tape measure domain-containing protein